MELKKNPFKNSKTERKLFITFRYAATVVAFVIAYCLTWAWLGNSAEGENKIGPGQQSTFTNVALICLAIGAVTSVVFHACIKVFDNVQPLTNSIGNFNELNEQNRHQGEFSDNMKMKNWFKQPQFYQVEKPVSMAADKNIDCKMAIRLKERSLQVAVIYMSSQLYINIYQSFYPFFLEDTLHMSATAVASIPLAMFIAGFAVSRYDHT